MKIGQFTAQTLGVAVFAFALVFVFAIATPVAHAQLEGVDSVSDGGNWGDGVNASASEWSNWSNTDWTGSVTGVDGTGPCCGFDQNGQPTSGFGGSSGFGGGSMGGGCSSCGGGSMGGGGFGGSSGFSSIPSFTSTPGGSTFAPSSIYSPTTAWDNGNTNTYAPYTSSVWAPYDSHNTTDSRMYDNGNTYAPIYAPSDSHNVTTVVTDSHNLTTNTYVPPATVVAPVVTQPTYQQPVYQQQQQYQYQAQYQQPSPQPYVYQQYQQAAPYVSLSQVPYTGLDLGPVGTVLYWAFLFFWCLAAAYLIAIKKVHKRLVSSMKGFLFGEEYATATGGVPQNAVIASSTPVAFANVGSDTDSFILSQIAR